MLSPRYNLLTVIFLTVQFTEASRYSGSIPGVKTLPSNFPNSRETRPCFVAPDGSSSTLYFSDDYLLGSHECNTRVPKISLTRSSLGTLHPPYNHPSRTLRPHGPGLGRRCLSVRFMVGLCANPPSSLASRLFCYHFRPIKLTISTLLYYGKPPS